MQLFCILTDYSHEVLKGKRFFHLILFQMRTLKNVVSPYLPTIYIWQRYAQKMTWLLQPSQLSYSKWVARNFNPKQARWKMHFIKIKIVGNDWITSLLLLQSPSFFSLWYYLGKYLVIRRSHFLEFGFAEVCTLSCTYISRKL